MESEQANRTLSKRLKVLYSSLLQRIFNQRIDSYRRGATVDEEGLLSRPLSAHIDRISATETSKPNGKQLLSSAINSCAREESEKRQSIPVLSKIWGGLTGHFKKSKQISVSNSCMSDKLMQSTWEHVHAAIRLARQGKQEQAQFHADIATNALKEAVHYMDDEEFKAFSDEITESLGKL